MIQAIILISFIDLGSPDQILQWGQGGHLPPDLNKLSPYRVKKHWEAIAFVFNNYGAAKVTLSIYF